MLKVKNKYINLIPQDSFDASLLGRIIRWALSSFRIMVIVTELIVMSAFLSRFWLDARNSDLNEELEIGEAQILAYEEIEKEINTVQHKLKDVKFLYDQPKTTVILEKISPMMPPDLSINSINKNQKTIIIKASSFLEKSIDQFITNLKSEPYFEKIALSQVTTSFDNPEIITFTVEGQIK